jgi:hypothetical protein
MNAQRVLLYLSSFYFGTYNFMNRGSSVTESCDT